MRIYDKDKLDNHYNNILKNNIDKIMLGGVGDTLLYDAKDDARMSLVVLIRMSSNITNNIIRHMEELKLLEPDLYYYPQEDFHITVMDILKGELGRTIPANINEYINTISRCAEEISAFEILFDGMTASDNVALVKGYYEESLEVFRKMLRDNLKQQGLPLEERYETFSSHISVARIPNKLKNPNEYIDFILGDLPFEKIVCRKDCIVFVLTGVRSGEIIYSPSGKPTMTHVIEMTEIAPSWFHCIFG